MCFNFLYSGIIEVKKLPPDDCTKVDLPKRDFLSSKFLTIKPTGLEDTGLNPEKRHNLWNKYGAYISPSIRNNGTT